MYECVFARVLGRKVVPGFFKKKLPSFLFGFMLPLVLLSLYVVQISIFDVEFRVLWSLVLLVILVLLHNEFKRKKIPQRLLH